jgi:hypothetical protein
MLKLAVEVIDMRWPNSCRIDVGKLLAQSNPPESRLGLPSPRHRCSRNVRVENRSLHAANPFHDVKVQGSTRSDNAI